MPLAHLHPIMVHMTLTLGVLWCLADLFSLRKKRAGEHTDGKNTPVSFLEGLILILIVTVGTGWIALAMKEKEGGPGSVFHPGRIHGNIALLTLAFLMVRFVLLKQCSSGDLPKHQNRWKKRLPPLFSLLALVSFLITGVLGERLVFHDGVTASKARPRHDVSSLSQRPGKV